MATKGVKHTNILGNKEIKQYLHSSALLFIFLGMCLIFALSSPTFMTMTNIINVFRQISINGILAIGMTLVIIIGGIDLSIGPLAAIAGVVSALILQQKPDSFLLAVVSGILAASVMSMWTAFLVAKMRIAPFIASLSTMSMAKGIVLVISSGVPHTISNAAYVKLGNGYLWDPKYTGNLALPIPVLIIAIVAVVIGIVLYKTKFGRHIYAVGGNEYAAIASGIKTTRIKFYTYMLNGLICGVAGVVLASRITSGQPTAATGYGRRCWKDRWNTYRGIDYRCA